MRRITSTLSILLAAAVATAAVPTAVEFSSEDIARAVQIAELRYGSDNLSTEQRNRRLAELMPPSEDYWYQPDPTDDERRDLLAPPLTLERYHEAGRKGGLEKLLREPAIQETVLELAAKQGRHHQARIMLRVASAVASAGDHERAWKLAIEAALLLPPGPDLARVHSLACSNRRPMNAGLVSLGSASIQTGETRLTMDFKPQPSSDGERCPLGLNSDLEPRIALAWTYPSSSLQMTTDSAEAWLERIDIFTESLQHKGDRDMLRFEALREVLIGSYGVSADWRAHQGDRLEELSNEMLAHSSGPLDLLAAAQALARVQRYDRAIELLEQSMDSLWLGQWSLKAVVADVRDARPDLALDFVRRLAESTTENRASRPLPCWLLAARVQLEDPETARPLVEELALGQCRPLGGRWNGSVRKTRKEVVTSLLEQGRAREAFAVQALRHYRSFCGNGYGAAVRALQMETARLQISAGLDERGAASAYLARMEDKESQPRGK